MKNYIKNLVSCILSVAFFILPEMSYAANTNVNGVMHAVNDTITTSAQSLGSISMTISGEQGTGDIVYAQSSTDGNTNWSNISVLPSGGGSYQTAMTANGSYTITGTGYGYFRLITTAVNTQFFQNINVNIIFSAASASTNTITTGTLYPVLPFLSPSGGTMDFIDDPSSQGPRVLFPYMEGNQPITAFTVSCLPPSAGGLASGIYDLLHAVTGGTVFFDLYDTTGFKSTLGSILIADSPSVGPYAPGGMVTLSSSVNLLPTQFVQIRISLSVNHANNGNNGYTNCNVSAIL